MIAYDTIFLRHPSPDADRERSPPPSTTSSKRCRPTCLGYRLLNEPQFDEPSINPWGGQALVTIVEVEGAGDYPCRPMRATWTS